MRARVGAVVVALLVVAPLAATVPTVAHADITTDCGASFDTPSCERLQAIYELLRDGNAHVIVDSLPAVAIDQVTANGNVVAFSENDTNHLTDISNVTHGDMWVLVGALVASGVVGWFFRSVFGGGKE